MHIELPDELYAGCQEELKTQPWHKNVDSLVAAITERYLLSLNHDDLLFCRKKTSFEFLVFSGL